MLASRWSFHGTVSRSPRATESLLGYRAIVTSPLSVISRAVPGDTGWRPRQARQFGEVEASQFRFTESMSSPKITNISLLQKLDQVYIRRHPVPLRGRRPSL